MKVGLDSYTVGCFKFNARQVIDYAAEHGCEGVQFGTPWELSPPLDEGEIVAVCDYAREKGMTLEVGIPSINPHRPHNRVRELGEGEDVQGFAKLLRLCTRVGAPSVRTYIGFQMERYDPNVPWQQMLDDTVKFLKRLAPILRDSGLKLGLETHQDATTFELLRVMESVGSDVVGITLDTANLPMRLEDPLEATKRVAPFVVMTHTKDSILFFGDDGLRWQARPCGQGAMPLAEMIALLPDNVMLSIEDHPRIYSIPIFDRAWLSSYPDLTAQELASLVRLARETEKRIASGEISDPEQEEAVSWEEKVSKRLSDSVRFLKGRRGTT